MRMNENDEKKAAMAEIPHIMHRKHRGRNNIINGIIINNRNIILL